MIIPPSSNNDALNPASRSYIELPSKTITRSIDTDPAPVPYCVLYMKGKENNSVPGGIVIKAFLSMKPTAKKSFSVNISTGETKVKFLGKLIEDLCELLVVYRELPLIRDIGIFKKKTTKPSDKKAPIDLDKIAAEDNSDDELKLSNQEVEILKKMNIEEEDKKPMKKLTIENIAKKVDDFFEKVEVKFSMALGIFDVALFENTKESNKVTAKPNPFIRIHIPESEIVFLKNDEKFEATVFGATITCTKQVSFVSQFVKDLKLIFAALSGNEAIKEYVGHYKKLLGNIEKRRIFKFDRSKALKIKNNLGGTFEDEERKDSELKEDQLEDNKLSKIIMKQESKAKLRAGLGSNNPAPNPSEVNI